MTDSVPNSPDARPRKNRDSHAELVHFLNQRYHREWERAEALQDKIDRIERLKWWRVLQWFHRQAGRFRSKPASSPSTVSPFAERTVPYEAVAATEVPRARISIVIPFKDRPELLRNCVRSLSASTYRRFEIILVDNGSTEPRTKRLLDRYGNRAGVSVVDAPGPFNFSLLCNRGASRATGDFLLFLNNDVEVLDRDWLERLLAIAGDPKVGIAGATLLYPDRTIQHAGIFPRADGVWIHAHRGQPEIFAGDDGELRSARTVPAVTAACLLMRRDLFQSLGGFDEQYPVMHNDVDLCTRVRRKGLLVVVTPHARLFHFESLSRGYSLPEPAARSV